MSDTLHHECGVVLLRFRKPFSYYVKKYGSLRYCMERLYLLMHKQHNRGQDGIGIATVKIHLPPGEPYMQRLVSTKPRALEEVFKHVFEHEVFQQAEAHTKNHSLSDQELAYRVPWLGEVMLGHLRYGTYGSNDEANCHPFIRPNNWRVRNILLAGNFNMTNNDELFDVLLSLGQHPTSRSDTAIVMEKIGHFLDEEVQKLYRQHKKTPGKSSISSRIEKGLDLQAVLQRACKDFDGGYVLLGLVGHGAAFVLRDKAGIRPAYYYADDEIIVVTSEKPPIKTAFQVNYDQIRPIPPAHALIVDSDGSYEIRPYMRAAPLRSCVFERIYFSRDSDPEIYQERKQLGRLLAPSLLKRIGDDLEHTIFSYIPNTSEVAFTGLIEGINEAQKSKKGDFKWPRIEKLISKDQKLRTFITQDESRQSLVSNIYNTTYELIRKGEDRLVVLDDSIVRGTTLQLSILSLLAMLQPKEIIIASAAPQIRYPDCYGIDMSRLQDFVAFRAVVALLEERNQRDLLQKVAKECKKTSTLKGAVPNFVKQIYAPFSEEEISEKIAQIIRPPDLSPRLQIVYLPMKYLRKACPHHTGDWYFSGNYPTEGGRRVTNNAFLHFMQGTHTRAYQSI